MQLYLIKIIKIALLLHIKKNFKFGRFYKSIFENNT